MLHQGMRMMALGANDGHNQPAAISPVMANRANSHHQEGG